ncbi:hypothetical protein [Dinghuibacter silviterrae]|uniref:Cro/C1-type helix-turn-helix DNA-binding protein n=1 Tax=Dinghuibacter silviterrae TaxID=1539049 RepID=A0A4R8DNW3_9BACT|nr:hypothetical protein [Dinghuibacter silviterrae]TDW99733.1 hypothetical protein EDB95_0744 [Dinghuibacter silviterrae]
MKQPDCYRILRAAFEGDELRRVRDIPHIVPVTILTRDMGLNYNTLSKRLLDPSRFTAADILRLSGLVGVKPIDVLMLIIRDVERR